MTKPDPIKQFLRDIGRKGGTATSDAKTAAARENARKPRPRKKARKVNSVFPA